MIKVKGNIVTFTGKDAKWLIRESKKVGMSKQAFFTGTLWEDIMRKAREGAFRGKKTV